MLQHLLVIHSFLLLNMLGTLLDGYATFTFTPSPADGHLDCFPMGARIENASINICVDVFASTCVFISVG